MNDLKGWDALELDGEALTAIKDAQADEGRELANLFHQTFVQFPPGARIFELMMQKYLVRPGPNGEVTPAGRHAGKADLVREILANIEISQA